MALHPPARVVLERIVANALEEDLGRGDLTTDACVSPELQGAAVFRARSELSWSGSAVIETVFRLLDPSVKVTVLVADGERLAPGDRAVRVEGPAGSILKGERVALNFVQRMTGIATLTRRNVDALPEGSRCRIADTRKTTPGLRAIERYAVRCGGGHNHREDLGAAVMIKDNHIAAAGSITGAIQAARAHAPHTARIECEVDTLEQLDEALAAGADILLLDNMDNGTVAEALRRIDGNAIAEASGNVTLDRIEALATLGVDVISIGALTHSAPSGDVGLDWQTA